MLDPIVTLLTSSSGPVTVGEVRYQHACDAGQDIRRHTQQLRLCAGKTHRLRQRR